MNSFSVLFAGIFLISPLYSFCQSDTLIVFQKENEKKLDIYGFARAGAYVSNDHANNNGIYFSTAYSDLSLKFKTPENPFFNSFADIRFRYGAEFNEPVSHFDIREAYIKISGKKWNLSAGQKIVLCGRADFTNPTSRLSPQDLLSRSPDREDINLANILADFNWFISEHINIAASFVPFYRPSVLIIEPLPLPDYVKINEINSIIAEPGMSAYGFKADFHFTGIDWSVSWFEGYNPMPGIALTNFNLDLTQPVPVPETELSVKPYKTRVVGLDFEKAIGDFTVRGEAAMSIPLLSYKEYEYVPLPETEFVAGINWFPGLFQITAEYSGKVIQNYTPAAADPVLGSEIDFAKLAQIMSTPGFDPADYVKQQVEAFNRLYNYQLKEFYHAAGIRISREMAYGKITPSVFSRYNFSSHDLLLIPEVKYKPADGLSITAGAEFYHGPNGSLFDLVHDFMSSVYISIRADF